LACNELIFTSGGSYVCAYFGENRSRNATVRVTTDGQTDRLTDANQFNNLSHAICCSYGTVIPAGGDAGKYTYKCTPSDMHTQ